MAPKLDEHRLISQQMETLHQLNQQEKTDKRAQYLRVRKAFTLKISWSGIKVRKCYYQRHRRVVAALMPILGINGSLNEKSLRRHWDGSAIVHYTTYLVPVGDEGDADVLLVIGGAQELDRLRDQYVTVDVTPDVRDQHEYQRNLHHKRSRLIYTERIQN